MLATAAAPPSGLVGGHLVHLLVLAVWLVVVVAVLAVEHIRSRRSPLPPARRTPAHPAAVPINAAAFIATWPPRGHEALYAATLHQRKREPAPGRRAKADVSSERRSPGALLQSAALGTFAAAATHGVVMPAHFRQSLIYGAFFLVVMSAQVVLGCLLLGRPSPQVLRAAVLGSASIVVVWAFSRVIGVPLGPDNGATEPVGALDVLATAAEAVTVVMGALALRTKRLAPSWRWREWPHLMRLASVLTFVAVMAIAWRSPKG
jgi:hypothetical protein